jgi:hypothetical protein
VNPISLDFVQEVLSRYSWTYFSNAQRISGNYFGVLVIVSIV